MQGLLCQVATYDKFVAGEIPPYCKANLCASQGLATFAKAELSSEKHHFFQTLNFLNFQRSTCSAEECMQ